MNEAIGSILIIDDDPDILFAAEMALKPSFSSVCSSSDPHDIPGLMRERNFDAVLLDMNFRKEENSGDEGYFWLKKIQEIDPAAVVVFMTAYGDVAKAVRSIKAGATDFILKPWQNEKLIATLSTAVRLRRSLAETELLKKQRSIMMEELNRGFSEIIGSSPAIMEIFGIIEKVAATEANVLILGENGSGKELIARAIHRRSLRKDRVFINVDMGAVSETLFESELFGHVKGAFTDAREKRMGRFEAADGGTLFLDEIANLPLHLQSKILSALQNREITPLGSNRNTAVDIRLISATNRNLHEMIRDGDFREDLFYRINTVEIRIPPLRERREDIPLLAGFFLAKFNSKYRKDLPAFSAAAVDKLSAYDWPGNIRELQHVVERSCIMASGRQIEADDIFLSAVQSVSATEQAFPSWDLEAVEQSVIRTVLKKHQGNISRAADELGLTRTSLYRRMEKYGL